MTQLPTLFAALADPTRFAIVERLLSAGETAAGDLSGLADISAPAMSRHLRVLREAGVIRQRIDGSRRIYSVAPEPFQTITDWVAQHRAFWEASLGRLEAVIQSRRREKPGA